MGIGRFGASTYYDIPKRRAELSSPTGIRYGLDMLNCPSSLNDIVEAILCGLTREALVMATKLEHFLSKRLPPPSSDQEMDSGYHFKVGKELAELAVCQWLRSNVIDKELLLRSASHYLKCYANKLKDIAPVLPVVCAAELYQDVIHVYQQPGGLKPPRFDSAIKCSGKASYVVAHYQQKGQSAQEQTQRSFGRFLRYYAANCLYVHSSWGMPDSIPILLMIDVKLKDSQLPAIKVIQSVLELIRTKAIQK